LCQSASARVPYAICLAPCALPCHTYASPYHRAEPRYTLCHSAKRQIAMSHLSECSAPERQCQSAVCHMPCLPRPAAPHTYASPYYRAKPSHTLSHSAKCQRAMCQLRECLAPVRQCQSAVCYMPCARAPVPECRMPYALVPTATCRAIRKPRHTILPSRAIHFAILPSARLPCAN
jgi:hypothetical protein